ncbi:hypothetical protein [Streptomyces sp. CL7]|uniref:hypothetical protein n=1 Tax=Streptomyces sp. CL7 TaxID=3096006 RepID=UPI002A7548A2|nr:hypothetical protein [Streptomyces sp. CL7]WPP30934.1 hypothetical protein SJH97_17135 [Streptomyces sp. CL7]
MPVPSPGARLVGVHPSQLADGAAEHRPAREVPAVTPWLRTLGATLVLGAGAVLLPYGSFAGPPGAAGVAHGAERTLPGSDAGDRARALSRSPSAPASPSRPASPSASRSGGGPDEGRDRPARPETAREESRDAREESRDTREKSRDTAPPRRGRAEEEHTGPREEAGQPDGHGVRRPDTRFDASAPADDAAEQSPAGDSDGAAPSGSDSSAAAPAPATSSRAAEPDTVAGTAVEPVLRILPLGSGLVLIGLGFALAFLGLRMRQERGAR